MIPPLSVIITGSGRGIGRAIACHLANYTNYRLLLTNRTESNATRVAAECNAIRPDSAKAYQWDVREESSGWLSLAIQKTPGPVALVHCAGILGATGPSSLVPVDDWRRVVDVNLTGSFVASRAVLSRMLADGNGRILLFSGGGACEGRPLFGAYAASKAGVLRFTETLAMEYASVGIAVVAIAPGACDTTMLQQTRAAGGEVKATVDIEEPCRLVARLLSEDVMGLSGRLVHSRDAWNEFTSASMGYEDWKLRRVV